MKITSYIQSAVNNLLGSRIRTLLAMMGIMIGTASVVALVSSGKLAANKAMDQFKSLGTDQMSLQISSNSNQSNQTPNPVKLETITAMASSIPDIVLIAPYTLDYIQAAYKTEQFNVNLIGAIQQLYPIIHLKMKQGRFISNLDKNQNYCVVGSKVLDKLKDINPLGQRIRLGKMIFIIIGVLDTSPENGFFWGNVSEGIFVPLGLTKLVNPSSQGISQAILVLREGADIEFVKKQINDFFAKNLPDYTANISSAKELLKSMNEQQDTLALLLIFIGGISLFVGGIGVMNIMLASVTERKYEIGLRLAIGAEPRDIQFMFLIEAIMLAVMGGGIGVLFGITCTYLVAVVSGWEYQFLFLPPLVGFCFSVLTSVFFGFYPAYIASKLNPIEALRSA
jgi:putative ABC transport system permease protein